jgi:hypothetical protein
LFYLRSDVFWVFFTNTRTVTKRFRDACT